MSLENVNSLKIISVDILYGRFPTIRVFFFIKFDSSHLSISLLIIFTFLSLYFSSRIGIKSLSFSIRIILFTSFNKRSC